MYANRKTEFEFEFEGDNMALKRGVGGNLHYIYGKSLQHNPRIYIHVLFKHCISAFDQNDRFVSFRCPLVCVPVCVCVSLVVFFLLYTHVLMLPSEPQSCVCVRDIYIPTFCFFCPTNI